MLPQSISIPLPGRFGLSLLRTKQGTDQSRKEWNPPARVPLSACDVQTSSQTLRAGNAGCCIDAVLQSVCICLHKKKR